MSCEDQACPPTKVCTRWDCDKAGLVRDGTFYICPKCRYSYGECPHPDFVLSGEGETE